jgi:glucose/arabinose dehydrogenase
MQRIALIVFLCLGAAACSTAQPSRSIRLVEAFPNLTFASPVDLQDPRDGSDRLFVLEQGGVIRVFGNSPSVASASEFLNISDRVVSGGERGLLGLAFDPGFSDNGYFYVDYTGRNPGVTDPNADDYARTVIARYSVDPQNHDRADPGSEQIILTIYQPYANHNGGQIAFGPDGYLYIAMGDGGAGGDPKNRAQNLDSLLGKILRIDVHAESAGRKYSIPPDNPFAGNTAGHREEIYAYGLRNPWRFSFDPVTGALWCGDVGQNTYEEIDIIRKGMNYGWPIMEGLHCYRPSSGCDTTGLTMPIREYTHSGNGVSITGGDVYRGRVATELTGLYIYADYTGKIWSLSYSGTGTPVNTLLLDAGFTISSFGTDRDNELYLCGHGTGRIYRFDAEASASALPAGPDLRLEGNEPNPFSGTTAIRYALRRAGPVRLTVHDLLGRIVATPVDGMQEPGSYSANFDARDLPAGIYFYALRSGDELSGNRRMVVVR